MAGSAQASIYSISLYAMGATGDYQPLPIEFDAILFPTGEFQVTNFMAGGQEAYNIESSNGYMATISLLSPSSNPDYSSINLRYISGLLSGYGIQGDGIMMNAYIYIYGPVKQLTFDNLYTYL